MALVGLSVGPHIASLAGDLVHLEVTEVDAAVSECQRPAPVLLPFEVLSVVLCTVWPSFNALAVLLIVEPFADVGRSVSVSVAAVPMGLIVAPLSLVHVTISVDKLAEAIGLVSRPFALVF